MNTIMNVRMSPELLAQAETVAKVRGYLTTQEYVREAIRQDVEKYLRIKNGLDAIIHSAKGIVPKKLTRAQRDALAKDSFSRKLTPTEKKALRMNKN